MKMIDLTGQKFNNLTVIGFAYTKNNAKYWKCKCDCGNEAFVKTAHLRNGHVKSCGCITVERAREANTANMVGKRFGNLVVDSFLGYKKDKCCKGRSYWHCKCDCGGTIDVVQDRLVSGNVKSCGCLKNKRRSNFVDLTGMRFNSLLVLSEDHVDTKTFWKCKCDCGNETVVAIDHLKSGHTTSCGCLKLINKTSKPEIELFEYLQGVLSGIDIKKSRVLGGKEIDIYIPELKIGIEYNGSWCHATENGIFSNKDKYYHRDKFLLAKSMGIRLVTIFDIDYLSNKKEVFSRIFDIVTNNENRVVPRSMITATDNDWDNGLWLQNFGYKEIGQVEPVFYNYNGFVVYRCGKTLWAKHK
jgi:hypothetical protein